MVTFDFARKSHRRRLWEFWRSIVSAELADAHGDDRDVVGDLNADEHLIEHRDRFGGVAVAA